MRRLFIIRKDLHLSPGKLAAMVAHCAEGYWTTLIKNFALLCGVTDNEFMTLPTEIPTDPDYWTRYRHPALYEKAKEAHEAGLKEFSYPRENPDKSISITVNIPKDIWNDYVKGIFTKTICEAKNLNHLMKVEETAKELGLVKGVDYDFIDDACLTELTPDSEDPETGKKFCRVGIWFKPLPDEQSHKLSKKYQLYKD